MYSNLSTCLLAYKSSSGARCAQTWYAHLYLKVSNSVWESYTPEQQLGLVVPRAEYIVYGLLKNRVASPGAAGGRIDKDAFCLPTLSGQVFMDKLMTVLQNRRSRRERLMCGVGCNLLVSLDLCANSGRALGGQWQVRLD